MGSGSRGNPELVGGMGTSGRYDRGTSASRVSGQLAWLAVIIRRVDGAVGCGGRRLDVS